MNHTKEKPPTIALSMILRCAIILLASISHSNAFVVLKLFSRIEVLDTKTMVDSISASLTPPIEIETSSVTYDDGGLHKKDHKTKGEKHREHPNKELSQAQASSSSSSSSSQPLVENNDIGIAMAGGSIRAASSCMGVLRGFQQKHVTSLTGESIPAMNKVRYNSGISGGSIPAILYSYAQVPVDELLDTNRTNNPSEITIQTLNEMPKTSMGHSFVQVPGQRWRIAKFLISTKFNILRLHSFWSKGIYKKVFKNYGIPQNKYISKPENLESILRDNPHLKRDEFLLPREDVKTSPLILFSMFGRTRDRNEYMKNFSKMNSEVWNQFHMQKLLEASYPISTNNEDSISTTHRSRMSDLVMSIRDSVGHGNMPIPFVGSADGVETRFQGKVQLQKGRRDIETVNFPIELTAPYEWGDERGWMFSRKRFSAEFLTSMSTNFPGSSGKNILSDFCNRRRLKFNEDGPEMSYRFADGGSNDLMGIMPLIQRNVKNIISIYNFNQSPPYADFSTTYADIYKHASCSDINDPNFNHDFTEWLKRMNPRLTCLFGFFGANKINHANILNHIFWDPNLDRLKEMMVKFNALYEAGEPLIVTLKDLDVIDNPFWSIKAGQKINLTMIYFNMPKKFSEQVPSTVSTVDENGRFNNPQLRSIPELSPDGLNVLRYSNAEINMMGYLGSWMVHRSWDGLKNEDGEVIFDGFGNIFT